MLGRSFPMIPAGFNLDKSLKPTGGAPLASANTATSASSAARPAQAYHLSQLTAATFAPECAFL